MQAMEEKMYKSIAIDGPSGAGKSTISKILANKTENQKTRLEIITAQGQQLQLIL